MQYKGLSFLITTNSYLFSEIWPFINVQLLFDNENNILDVGVTPELNDKDLKSNNLFFRNK